MKYLFINTALILYILFITWGYLAGVKPLIVVSNSMAPVIKKGYLIFISKNESYSVNDIITFKNKNRIVTHRIVTKIDNRFGTRGDANKLQDLSLISKKVILGKLMFSVPFLGYLFIFFQSNYFIVLLIIFIIYLLLKKYFKKALVKNEKL